MAEAGDSKEGVILLDPSLQEASTDTDVFHDAVDEVTMPEKPEPSDKDKTESQAPAPEVELRKKSESPEKQEGKEEVSPTDVEKEALTRTESTQSNLSQVTVTSGDSSELSPLFSAIDDFDTKAVEAVLKSGASVTDTDDAERNPAHFLIMTYCKLHPLDRIEVKQRLISILQLLVENGVNINAGDKKKQAPLHIAASCPENAHIIKPMLASGAKVNQQDGQNRTALHYAVAKGDEENAKALVEGGANPNIQDNNKQSSLHLAVKSKRNLSLVQFLLSCGADPNIVDRAQKSPLHIAAKAGRPELIKELLNYGANVNLCDSSGQSAMHLAAVYDITGKSLRELLMKPADINIKDAITGDTPLHKAVSLNMQDNIRVLAKHHANPNCQDITGETPLHRAYNIKEFVIWQELLKLKGDVQVRNESGYTVLFKALKAKNDVALAVMRQYGVAD